MQVLVVGDYGSPDLVVRRFCRRYYSYPVSGGLVGEIEAVAEQYDLVDQCRFPGSRASRGQCGAGVGIGFGMTFESTVALPPPMVEQFERGRERRDGFTAGTREQFTERVGVDAGQRPRAGGGGTGCGRSARGGAGCGGLERRGLWVAARGSDRLCPIRLCILVGGLDRSDPVVGDPVPIEVDSHDESAGDIEQLG